jgi:diguanylate cyclase (GGDEF)-like protein/PAS domain S-box-containing protein
VAKAGAELLQILFDRSPDALLVTRLRDTRVLLVNDALCRMLGYGEEELVGRRNADLRFWTGPDDEAADISTWLRRKPEHPVLAHWRTRDGDIREVEISVELVDIDGETHAYGVSRDVTERNVAERALRASEERFRILVHSSRDAILVTDRSGTLTYASPGIEHVLGYPPAELQATSERDLIHPEDLVVRDELVARLVVDGAPQPAVELRMRHRDGGWRWVETIDTNRLDTPAVRGIVTNARDITERRQAAEALTFHALHDPLTGLANRRKLDDHLELALARARRGDGTVAVFFCDLDRFKDVNDRFSHADGDQLLREVATRLKAVLRAADTLARVGGDEFVLCTEVFDVTDVGEIAERICATVSAPVQLTGGSVTVTASIGIATTKGVDARKIEASMLIRNADVAMYRAKSRGRSRWEIYDAAMQEQTKQRMRLEHGLADALDAGQFVLHYQPIVHLPDRAIVGLEALLRWQHPDRGLLAPAEFLGVAEDTGRIVAIGEWVLTEVAGQLRRWQSAGFPALWASVNVSGKQVGTPGIAAVLARCEPIGALTPGTLRLEITESVLLRSTDAVQTDLATAVANGLRIGMDDFGTGYCSLSYLNDFPISFLKIDRSFVADLPYATSRTNLLDAILGLSRTLNIEAIAEGVEIPAQAGLLDQLGCTLGQGFLYASPLPVEAVTSLLAAGRL